MNLQPRSILVIQTAFIGDAILTLPLIQAARRHWPQASIDVVVVPRAADLFANHPDIRTMVRYDKRNDDRGLRGFRRILAAIRKEGYDLALLPHRSLRSALLAWWGGIPVRVGFDRSTLSSSLTTTVPYNERAHEIERNLSLLEPFGVRLTEKEFPRVYPSSGDRLVVDQWLRDNGGLIAGEGGDMVGVAPGTVWNTKRWPEESFRTLCARLVGRGIVVVLVGGKEDEALCGRIRDTVPEVLNGAGALSLLQSAELIRRTRVLVSNDSAPMHLAVAVGTPVVAIFGATVPAFGFSPYGPSDRILETPGLACRPCSIHGGDVCPIGTFDCMNNILPEHVLQAVDRVRARPAGSPIP